jgi:hypothetical protein
VTHLRKIMLEELQRRHYSEGTTRKDRLSRTARFADGQSETTPVPEPQTYGRSQPETAALLSPAHGAAESGKTSGCQNRVDRMRSSESKTSSSLILRTRQHRQVLLRTGYGYVMNDRGPAGDATSVWCHFWLRRPPSFGTDFPKRQRAFYPLGQSKHLGGRGGNFLLVAARERFSLHAGEQLFYSLSLSFAPSIRVEDPTLSIVAIRLRVVSVLGARDSITFQRPLNSSISAMSFRISGVMVMFLISWVRISIYTQFHPIYDQWQAMSRCPHIP